MMDPEDKPNIQQSGVCVDFDGELHFGLIRRIVKAREYKGARATTLLHVRYLKNVHEGLPLLHWLRFCCCESTCLFTIMLL